MSIKYRNETLIELHVPDFQAAYDYYHRLGFEMAWLEDDYLVMHRDANVLAFYGGSPEVSRHSYFGRFPAESKRGYGVEVVIFVDDVHALYESAAAGLKVISPLQKRPWGRWDFRIEDPFGFYVRVSERYDPLHQPKKQQQSSQTAKRLGLKLEKR